MPVDVRSPIYYLTPVEPLDTTRLVALVREVLAAGVGLVQYRAKDLSTRRMYEDVAALLAVTRPAGVPLIVNDSVEVALAAGADGVHVGQEDLPVALTRRLVGPYAILGVSAESPGQARLAEREGADYVACGPILPSPVKPERPALGPAALTAIRRAVSVPVCAIGGITAANLGELREARPDLVAVVASINGAADPGAAARELVSAAEVLWPSR